MTESYSALDKVMLYYGDTATGELGAHFSFNFLLLSSQETAVDVVTNINLWYSTMPSSYTANWLVSCLLHLHHRILILICFRLEITIITEQLQGTALKTPTV